MYLINSMKSYSIENIRIQDILLISICILLFLNRAVPIDYSSIWRVTVLCLYIRVYALCQNDSAIAYYT